MLQVVLRAFVALISFLEHSISDQMMSAVCLLSEITELRATVVCQETAYQVVSGMAKDLQRSLDFEKKLHEVTRREVDICYALLSKAYELHRSPGRNISPQGRDNPNVQGGGCSED